MCPNLASCMSLECQTKANFLEPREIQNEKWLEKLRRYAPTKGEGREREKSENERKIICYQKSLRFGIKKKLSKNLWYVCLKYSLVKFGINIDIGHEAFPVFDSIGLIHQEF